MGSDMSLCIITWRLERQRIVDSRRRRKETALVLEGSEVLNVEVLKMVWSLSFIEDGILESWKRQKEIMIV